MYAVEDPGVVVPPFLKIFVQVNFIQDRDII